MASTPRRKPGHPVRLMPDDFDDEIPDLTGKGQPVAAKPFVPRAPLVQGAPPANYVPMEKRFTEPCPKCKGSGRFFNVGPCFNCKGLGKKTYKTPPQERAKARSINAAKALEKAVEAEQRAARLRKFYGIP